MTFLNPVFLLLLVPCVATLWLWRLPGRYMTGARLVVYVLLVLALARPAIWLARRSGVIVVVADRSASMTGAALRQQEEFVATIQDARRGEGRLAVVSFGADATLEHAPQHASFNRFTVAHDTDASALSDALALALSHIPHNSAGRLIVFSDGHYTGEDPLQQAAFAASRGIAIDYRLQARPAADDTAILRIDAPQELRAGEGLLATVWVDTPVEQDVTLSVRRGNQRLLHTTRRLPRGTSPLVFRDMPDAPGVFAYHVTVTPSLPDALSENNDARFLVRRQGGKPLICVPASPQSRLPELLALGGVNVVTVAPDAFDGSLANLAGVSGVVIENTRADALPAGALQNLSAWVEHAGGGLLLTGGKNMFGPGGYYKSPIDDILPVSMELRREHRKFAMSIAVALDRSGSMAVRVDGGKTKMDLANLGTMEVLNLLSDQDEMAVLAVDSSPHIIVNLSPAGNVRATQRQRILGIESMGGGIFVYEALAAAARQLEKAGNGVRHIILFADADDSEEPGDYRRLLAALGASGVTVSVIALGTEASSDANLLKDIARLGNGRCLFTQSAHEVPRLFAQDTFMVARNTWITNAVLPRFTTALPQLSDLLPPNAPAVGGYNLCYLRPEALAIALTDDEHHAPLVAMRWLGAGRTLTFTAEADGANSGPFAQWDHIREFYAALARHTAGPVNTGASGFLPVQTPIPGGVRVTLHADLSIPGVSGADLTLRVIRQAQGQHEPAVQILPLAWQTPDTLHADLPLKGGETLLATITYPNGQTDVLPPACLPYSPEFAPAATRDGAATLTALANATGGAHLADLSRIWQTLPKQSHRLELTWLLYLLAALLFLIEIFERRTGWLASRLRRTTISSATDEPEKPFSTKKTSPKKPDKKPPSEPPSSPGAPEKTEPAESLLQRAKRRAGTRTR